MQLKSTTWLHASIFCTILLASSGEAIAASPRIVVEVGQTVAQGWRVLGIGPAVAVNDARQSPTWRRSPRPARSGSP